MDVATILLLAVASTALPSAGAATLQASPEGSGTACSANDPCALAVALSMASEGDDIVIAGARQHTRTRARACEQSCLAAAESFYSCGFQLRALPVAVPHPEAQDRWDHFGLAPKRNLII